MKLRTPHEINTPINRPFLPFHLEHQTSLCLHNSHLSLPVVLSPTPLEGNYLGRHPCPPSVSHPPQPIHLPPEETPQTPQIQIQVTLEPSQPHPQHARYTATKLPTSQIPNHRPHRTHRFPNKRHAGTGMECAAVGRSPDLGHGQPIHQPRLVLANVARGPRRKERGFCVPGVAGETGCAEYREGGRGE